jgi:type I restriction enzyme R subunit
MSAPMPTEKRFEDFIEKALLKHKTPNVPTYNKHHFEKYDRELCLIPEEVLSFIKSTQDKDWAELIRILGVETDRIFLKTLSVTINQHGLLRVLREGLALKGQKFKLAFFEPNSGNNPDAWTNFKKNKFTIIRQLHYSIKNENSIDTGIFLNGIPIITIELKNQLTGQFIQHAKLQYQNDRDPKEPLLSFKKCLAHFAVDNDEVAMTTKLNKKSTRFLPYNKNIENPHNPSGYKVDYFWKEILTPRSLLDIIENFVHLGIETDLIYDPRLDQVIEETSDVLIFPRYHQLDLIRKLKRTIKEEGPGQKYLIQHTTGSGKSYSIGWLSHLLASLFRNKTDPNRMFDSIIVVTDRKVLDKQLQKLIQSLSRVKGQVKAVEGTSADLRKYLENSNDIIISTIQKFPVIAKAISSLGDKKFAVIIDEVHSSQSGKSAQSLKKVLSTNGDGEVTEDPGNDYEDMIHKIINSRKDQKNISFFGFTGTPKNKTLELFGRKNEDNIFEAFHTYTMRQSISENFTLNVLSNYTTYNRFFELNNPDVDIETQSAEAKRRVFEQIDKHPKNLSSKSSIILNHFTTIASKEINGQARGMIVVKSRAQCVRFFKEINKQLDDRGSKYRALVAFSGEVTDLEELPDETYTEEKLNSSIGMEGDIPRALKHPRFRLLIVSNKYQTGFDEPLLQSMYIDKKLHGVQCVQTLSRLNRTRSGKERTFILDFVNSVDEVLDSFNPYFESTVLDGETNDQQLYNKKIAIEEFHLYEPMREPKDFCKLYFATTRQDSSLQPPLNKVLANWKQLEDEEREEFRKLIQSYIKLYEYISQIIPYSDTELEELYIFLFFAARKLPPLGRPEIDIPEIEIPNFLIRRTEDAIGDLSGGNEGILTPPTFATGQAEDPPWELLSELLNRLNEEYGTTFTEAQKKNIETIQQILTENKEVEDAILADNTEQNKEEFFMKKVNEEFDKYFTEEYDFYEKTQKEEIKNSIVRIMFHNVTRQIMERRSI